MKYIAQVKKTWYLLLILLPFCTSCSVAKRSSFDPAKKYSPAELKKDFSLFYEILQLNHPSLYWYASKDSVDNYFSATNTSLTDSLTEQQFRNKIAWAIAKIHCGHTAARPSQKASEYYIKKQAPFFPLSMKVWKDSAVVIQNALQDSSILKRGTVVTGINGFTTSQILDSLCSLIGTDGYSDNFKYQVISFNFSAYYKNAFGLDSTYLVGYIDSAGQQRETTVKNFIPATDTLRKRLLLENRLTRKEFRNFKLSSARNLRIDTSLKTAFLSVNTFSEGKLIHFFRRSFSTIKKEHIKNVVLDLRLNSGGSVHACTRLTQYLIDKPFHVADTVATYNRSFKYKKYIKPWFVYWLSMHFSGRRLDDGRIHFRYFEKHYYKPKKGNHFDGNIYVLTGGYTFSAGALVAENLKGQNNVTIVGEETGGGAYGNSAMHLTTIVLPATGIRITLPLYRLVLNANHPKNGRGVLPDIQVKPSSVIIKSGKDAKMEKVLSLIKNPEAERKSVSQ